jgi:hypothetical protein
VPVAESLVGMFGEPPGWLPAAGLAVYDDVEPVSVEVVPDVNHYPIVFAPAAAARAAATVTSSSA